MSVTKEMMTKGTVNVSDNDYKMDPALKAKWIAALRSGDYKQGRGELKCGGNYCCLGVLCEVGELKEVPRHADYPNAPSRSFEYDGVGVMDEYLPNGFSGMPWRVQQILAEMNDSGWSSFKSIADYIEENY